MTTEKIAEALRDAEQVMPWLVDQLRAVIKGKPVRDLTESMEAARIATEKIHALLTSTPEDVGEPMFAVLAVRDALRRARSSMGFARVSETDLAAIDRELTAALLTSTPEDVGEPTVEAVTEHHRNLYLNDAAFHYTVNATAAEIWKGGDPIVRAIRIVDALLRHPTKEAENE
jgi:hypothetical protein